MTVTLKSLSARGEGRVAVLFEIQNEENIQRETFLVSAAAVADLSLRVGECTSDCFEKVEQRARLEVAEKRALQILSYGSCSEKMLCRKLVMKGISREIAEEAVVELCAKGFLDSSASAVREVEKGIAKLWGRKRIAAALFEKGYADRTVREALSVLSEVDEVELCARRIEKQVGEIPADINERRKLIASLERHGFSSSQIREAFLKLSL